MKEYKFEQLPIVLVLQLKRFAFDGTGTDKISKFVSFPHRMVLPKYFMANPRTSDDTDRTFSLFSVITHYGRHASGGHYKCDVQQEDGQWLCFDDSNVRGVASREVMESSAYLLFYMRLAAGE